MCGFYYCSLSQLIASSILFMVMSGTARKEIEVEAVSTPSMLVLDIPSPSPSAGPSGQGLTPLVAGPSAQSALPFSPMSVAWTGIKYTVTLTKKAALSEGRAKDDRGKVCRSCVFLSGIHVPSLSLSHSHSLSLALSLLR